MFGLKGELAAVLAGAEFAHFDVQILKSKSHFDVQIQKHYLSQGIAGHRVPMFHNLDLSLQTHQGSSTTEISEQA